MPPAVYRTAARARAGKILRGELAERSNAAVLKTVSPQGLGGSNPSLSARTCPSKSGLVQHLAETLGRMRCASAGAAAETLRKAAQQVERHRAGDGCEEPRL